jgi:hypothetical protein
VRGMRNDDEDNGGCCSTSVSQSQAMFMNTIIDQKI